MDTQTKVDIEAIRARAEAASPAPWREGVDGNLRVYAADGLGERSGPVAGFVRRADVTFIASARTDIPALCDEIEAMRPVVEAARTLIDGYNSKQNKSRAGTVANLRAHLADFDARAARSPILESAE